MRFADVVHHVVGRVWLLAFRGEGATEAVNGGEEDLAGYAVDRAIRLPSPLHAEHPADPAAIEA